MLKQFVFSTFFFVFILLVAYVGLLFAFSYFPKSYRPNLPIEPVKKMHIHYLAEDLKKLNAVDVVFLGSSHAYRGFDVRIFQKNGISSFNLGTSSQTPLQTDVIARKYLPQLKPKLVIYEVYPYNFCVDGVESSIDYIQTMPFDFDLFQLTYRSKHIKSTHAYFLRLPKNILLSSDKFGASEKADTCDYYIPGGYTAKIPTTSYRPQKKEVDKKYWDFSSDQTYYFNKTISYLKNKKIPFILIQAPYTKELYNSYLNQLSADSLFQAHGRYINYNGKLPLLDSVHFYDDNHLNQLGVELFNQQIIRDLF